MLLVVAALGLDAVQRVEVAQPAEQLVALRGGGERLEHDQVDPGAGGLDDVVLAVDEHVERVAAGVDAALQPAGGAGQQVLVAPAEQVELGLAREQVAVVVAAGEQRVGQLAQRGPLGEDAERLPGHELRRAERVELAERVLVVGQQVLGRELQQDRVVALERGEHVRVGLQRREAVGLEVAGAAARLAAGLDRVGGVPGGHRLDARGERLQLALAPVVGSSSVKTPCSSFTSRCWANESA